MKVKTSELSGFALDWAVAKLEGVEYQKEDYRQEIPFYYEKDATRFSSSWAQGGPIIEREGITLERFKDTSYWSAFNFRTGDCEIRCKSPLLAAMRCYVASKLGGVVEVPDELIVDKDPEA